MCRSDPRHKVRSEFAFRFSVDEFFPGPLFLDQVRSLSKTSFLLPQLAVWKSVGDHDVETMVFHPLSKLSVRNFPSVAIAQPRITMRCACLLRDFDRGGGDHQTTGDQDCAKSCDFCSCQHTCTFVIGRRRGGTRPVADLPIW